MISPETFLGLGTTVQKRALEIFSTNDEKAAHILNVVCNYFGQSVEDILGKSRKGDYANARQIAMYFLRQRTTLSWEKIGKMIGGRDHSTVIYSCTTVQGYIDIDLRYALKIKDIEALL